MRDLRSMYKTLDNFITDEEQQYVKSFIAKRITELGGNLRSYSDHEQKYHEVNERTTEPIAFFRIDKDIGVDEKLTSIIHRMQDAAKVSHDNPCTYFNWVISLSPIGTEVLNHIDPLDEELSKTKKIIRMNVLVQNAKRGGNFDLLDDSGWNTAIIPDKALMIFEASEIPHRITKNLSSVTRINLSIDAVVDK